MRQKTLTRRKRATDGCAYALAPASDVAALARRPDVREKALGGRAETTVTPTEEQLFLRREPTSDPVLLAWAPDAARERCDVVAYSDAAMTDIVRRWPWHFTFSKPRRFRKRLKIGGRRFAIVWLSDAPIPAALD